MQAEVCYALGREHLRRGEIHDGERLLRSAWASDRTLVSAAAALARSHAQHGDRFDDAHAVLDDAFQDEDSTDLLLVVRAEVLIDEGRVEDARAAAQAGLDQASTETTRSAARAALARVYNLEGIELAGTGEYEHALFCFKRAADHDPNWSSPHVNVGACFRNMGRENRALAAYRRAVVVDPGNSIAHHNLGLLQRELGDLPAARVALAAAIDADTANIEAWVDLGATLTAAGERDGAETCFRQALDLDPDHEGACMRLADLLTRDARYLEAAVLAERASDIATRRQRQP